MRNGTGARSDSELNVDIELEKWVNSKEFLVNTLLASIDCPSAFIVFLHIAWFLSPKFKSKFKNLNLRVSPLNTLTSRLTQKVARSVRYL
jgi:hypothetical protein